MGSIILAINAGSSSVKVSVYEAKGDNLIQLADAQIAGLSAPPAQLTYTRGEHKVKGQEVNDVKDQSAAFARILELLLKDDGLPALKRKEDIRYACHRIVHGGDYTKPTIIDKDAYHHLEELSELAPLHNGVALEIVHAVHEQLPSSTVNMAYFDSAFHATMPKHVTTYPIDPAVAKEKKLRKYGFHGISYAFITQAVAKHLGKPESEVNLIALHLGSGASACAIRGGKSIDTSMGLTPLAGLPGATRSGDVDPSLVFHYTSDAGKLSPSSTKDMHISTAEEILNKKSGLKALAGTTDFGKIASSKDEECKLAFDIFADRILGFVGNYYVKLGGQVDALVFAGGIGEKGASLREAIVKQSKCLGFELDPAKNNSPNDKIVDDIGKDGAKHRTLICQTDEQVSSRSSAH